MDKYYRGILEGIGEDPERAGLLKTPERAAEAFRFLTQGYNQSVEEIINGAIYEETANHMVVLKDIEIFSMCEHHMLPFFGKCHVGYIPCGKVFGVSKIARLVDCFARRLQLQERLTDQIARAVMEPISAEGVGVVIEANHLCMMMRGVEKQHSAMKTSAMLGSFREDSATRNEFLHLIN